MRSRRESQLGFRNFLPLQPRVEKVTARAPGTSPVGPRQGRQLALSLTFARWSLITRHLSCYASLVHVIKATSRCSSPRLSFIRRLSINPEWHSRCRLSQKMGIPGQKAGPGQLEDRSCRSVGGNSGKCSTSEDRFVGRSRKGRLHSLRLGNQREGRDLLRPPNGSLSFDRCGSPIITEYSVSAHGKLGQISSGSFSLLPN
ncbi:hypothetical protein F5144DRAFT_307992 [Chaetomium tenue]|uniref:Uncharacterized protein n=1 Tax=Chaetomium tenue TaxID=1854479 RepID=A0ACB7P747_9PEZI|nr:hypothetical protein F5144DRAFT_307992 [Chaetomium globosum]